jgi:hypothetical protein
MTALDSPPMRQEPRRQLICRTHAGLKGSNLLHCATAHRIMCTQPGDNTTLEHHHQQADKTWGMCNTRSTNRTMKSNRISVGGTQSCQGMQNAPLLLAHKYENHPRTPREPQSRKLHTVSVHMHSAHQLMPNPHTQNPLLRAPALCPPHPRDVRLTCTSAYRSTTTVYRVIHPASSTLTCCSLDRQGQATQAHETTATPARTHSGW